LDLIIKQVLSQSEKGELLVIDDGSTDGTIELLSQFEKKYTSVFRFIKNNHQGIAKTRNLLLKESLGKYIIFIDSDIFIAENFVSSHLKILLSNKNIISQGSLIEIREVSEAYKKKFNVFTDYSRAFFATGNVSIERQKIIDAGGFDENFTGYGWEDLELGIRLKKLGLKAIKSKDTFAYHYNPYESINNLDKLIQKEKDRAIGAIYFLDKHPILDVRLMTQATNFHIYLDKILFKFLKTKRFTEYLNKLEENKDYNRLIPLLRLYLNHFNVIEIEKLLKK